jgi:hypothetical protein
VTVDAVGFSAANPLVVDGSVRLGGSLIALGSAASTSSVFDLGRVSVSKYGSITDILPSSASYLGSVYSATD